MLFRHHALALPPQSRFLWRERGDTVKVPETPDRAAVPPSRRKARQAPPRKWAGTVTSRVRWGYRQPSASVPDKRGDACSSETGWRWVAVEARKCSRPQA